MSDHEQIPKSQPYSQPQPTREATAGKQQSNASRRAAEPSTQLSLVAPSALTATSDEKTHHFITARSKTNIGGKEGDGGYGEGEPRPGRNTQARQQDSGAGKGSGRQGCAGGRTPSHPARRATPAEPSGKEGGCRKNGGEVM